MTSKNFIYLFQTKFHQEVLKAHLNITLREGIVQGALLESYEVLEK
jgi:hypothetical protein